MSFLKIWAPHFQPSVRTRGRTTYESDRVKLVDPQGDALLRAQVSGKREQHVTLKEDASCAVAQCTCDTFADGQYCHHIWAMLLHVQSQLEDGAPGDPLALRISHVTKLGARPPKARKRDKHAPASSRGEPAWVGRLSLLRPASGLATRATPILPERRQVCYLVHTEMSTQQGALVVQLRQRQPGRRGWSRLKLIKINRAGVALLPEADDRSILTSLVGSAWIDEEGFGRRSGDERQRDLFKLPAGGWRSTLRDMIATGRCFLLNDEEEAAEVGRPLRWDDGEPWRLWLVGQITDDALNITIELRCGERRLGIDQPELIIGGPDGLVIHNYIACPFEDRGATRWINQFRDDFRTYGDVRAIHVPGADVPRFLGRLYHMPQLPELDLPASLKRSITHVAPEPHMSLSTPTSTRQTQGLGTRTTLLAQVWFTYEQVAVQVGQPGRFVNAPLDGEPDADAATAPAAHVEPTESVMAEGLPDAALIERDMAKEQAALETLVRLGFRANSADNGETLLLNTKAMPGAIAQLLLEGWDVSADRKVVRAGAPPKLRIKSGIDWFELHGQVQFETETGTQVMELPELLVAVRAGQTTITLDDGSQGLLPEQWLRQHGLLTAIGHLEDDHLRFKSTQASLLDALLADTGAIDIDEQFAQVRRRLESFERIEPVNPANTFTGTLRGYQRDGLGWLGFLIDIGMGGILADDMGLGKTVQVLAALDAMTGHNGDQQDDGPGPSLIVVPRSLIFNWMDEAKRFTPQLRMLAYTGTDRAAMREQFDQYDLIVTSYGLLRRDIEQLIDHRFNYVVLDEAQAIKNPQSQATKAARLVNANHRLALTGTPVENHLGDLWAIFEFLNPGMLGDGTRFHELIFRTSPLGGDDDDDSAPQNVEESHTSTQVAVQAGNALRPFILRRTKQQVLDELPEKTEQTIVCQMEPPQRKLYDELLVHYRQRVLGAFDESGNAKTTRLAGGRTMMVLEALLRLRQAACHPGLIDPKRATDPSAKLDVLMFDLDELVEEGHKALVFSQFTSMLALVRQRMDKQGITYEYLDGQTRDRKACVERFQNDPKCPVFLISLKAGGFGLNLTAADYVFILDPWWNPAVEQQAIDRAHRIGQTRHVFAYRLICEDTVEQRIAELQQQKKQLADAIMDNKQDMLRQLTREDMERLLS